MGARELDCLYRIKIHKALGAVANNFSAASTSAELSTILYLGSRNVALTYIGCLWVKNTLKLLGKFSVNDRCYFTQSKLFHNKTKLHVHS